MILPDTSMQAYLAQVQSFFVVATRTDFLPRSILDAQATYLYLTQILAHAEEALTSEEYQRLCQSVDKYCTPLLLSERPFLVELATLHFSRGDCARLN